MHNEQGPCIVKYTTGNEIADCNQLDIACICSNEQFLDGIACCLEDACDDAGKKAAVAYARQICSTQNVQVPDQVVCKNPSSSGSDSTAAAGTETSTGTESASETAATTDQTTTTGTATETDASGSTTTSSTGTADQGSSTETDAPDAAHKALVPAGGILGAVIALVFAL